MTEAAPPKPAIGRPHLADANGSVAKAPITGATMTSGDVLTLDVAWDS